MSYSATVTINDTATPEVKARIASFGRPLNSVMGRAVVNLWQRNFLKWNQDNPNKLGGTRTNLGAQFARATQFQSAGGRVCGDDESRGCSAAPGGRNN
jgi:hypothetical protein